MHKKLILIRHGESEGNKKGILQGSLDEYGLTETGRQQALCALLLIKRYKPELIMTSPLKRALETAEIIRNSLDYTPSFAIEPLLSEVNLGILEGVTKEERNEKYPDETAALRNSNYDYSVFQGEPIMNVRERAKKFMEKVISSGYGTIAAITHGAFLRNAMEVILQIDGINLECKNGAVFLINFKNGVPLSYEKVI